MARMQRVLIVDDQPKETEFLQKGLGSLGYLVNIARTTNDGYELALEHRPDLIVCDLSFNGEDGWEFGKRVMMDPRLRGIPMLIYTNKELDEGDLERAREAGFLAYKRKPLQPWKQVQEITEYLRKP